jgi:4-amino-4-deoxy-L-arabinose transferase-like glycosyltransferase
VDFIKKIKKYDRTTILLSLIILVAFILRLYYFIKFGDQALWYDEADYFLRAKVMAFQELADAPYAARKPVFMVFIWTAILKLGLGELFMKFIQVIISTVTVYGIYLLGKEVRSKEAGLILATLLTTFYLHLFFSIRVMLDEPAFFATVFAAYFFVKWYKSRKTKDIVWAGIFTGLAIQIFYIPAYLLAVFFIFLLFTDRLKFFKDKQSWYALLALGLSVLPWLIWSWLVLGDPFYGFRAYQGTGEVLVGYDSGLDGFFKVIPTALFAPLFAMFVAGLVKVFLDIYVNFKQIVQRKTKRYDMDIFFLIWLILFPIALAIEIVHVEPRYMLPAFIPAFYFIATALLFFKTIIEKNVVHKYAKQISILLVVLFLVYTSFTQVSYADDLISLKSVGFEQEKPAAAWLEENTEEDDYFVSCNQQVIFQAYTGRNGAAFGTNIEALDQMIEENKPKYLILDAYVGDCAFEHPQENPEQFELVKIFFADEAEQQPVILIYEVLY